MSKIKWFGPVVAIVLLALAMGSPTLNAKASRVAEEVEVAVG